MESELERRLEGFKKFVARFGRTPEWAERVVKKRFIRTMTIDERDLFLAFYYDGLLDWYNWCTTTYVRPETILPVNLGTALGDEYNGPMQFGECNKQVTFVDRRPRWKREKERKKRERRAGIWKE